MERRGSVTPTARPIVEYWWRRRESNPRPLNTKLNNSAGLGESRGSKTCVTSASRRLVQLSLMPELRAPATSPVHNIWQHRMLRNSRAHRVYALFLAL